MKRLTTQLLPIRIKYNVSDIHSIKFVFTNGVKRLLFTYPSDNAFRLNEDENIILLRFTQEQTAFFDGYAKIKMDTFITLRDSDINPETPIKTIDWKPTLFYPDEVGVGDGR